MRQLIVMLLVPILLAGCATGPRYDTHQVALDLLPATVSENPESYRDNKVLWGGLIVATHNLPDHTEIEMLSYPLNQAQRPLADRPTQGRFLLRQAGYLEELDYAPGRQVTVKGVLAAAKQGQVGEVTYTYPVVEAQDLYLWPPARHAPERTRFHIGIGVIFGR
ncbi:Slp family lipoprotein [Desulfurivibrio dismutans]|uniref:Slp family lipoprotein n=1 Tax=Desulfurivibrio dismutans TaxID=1398908 RepID=UPI0023DBC078|nr:Slp family lipoprotein [Desulfurivibrio alkaliphilus]MDF1615110.1 Slp family lipoprotein [Desulfurivibrio alkaliphilus]